MLEILSEPVYQDMEPTLRRKKEGRLIAICMLSALFLWYICITYGITNRHFQPYDSTVTQWYSDHLLQIPLCHLLLRPSSTETLSLYLSGRCPVPLDTTKLWGTDLSTSTPPDCPAVRTLYRQIHNTSDIEILELPEIDNDPRLCLSQVQTLGMEWFGKGQRVLETTLNSQIITRRCYPGIVVWESDPETDVQARHIHNTAGLANGIYVFLAFIIRNGFIKQQLRALRWVAAMPIYLGFVVLLLAMQLRR